MFFFFFVDSSAGFLSFLKNEKVDWKSVFEAEIQKKNLIKGLNLPYFFDPSV